MVKIKKQGKASGRGVVIRRLFWASAGIIHRRRRRLQGRKCRGPGSGNRQMVEGERSQGLPWRMFEYSTLFYFWGDLKCFEGEKMWRRRIFEFDVETKILGRCEIASSAERAARHPWRQVGPLLFAS